LGVELIFAGLDEPKPAIETLCREHSQTTAPAAHSCAQMPDGKARCAVKWQKVPL
jgi:hypothetical protein